MSESVPKIHIALPNEGWFHKLLVGSILKMAAESQHVQLDFNLISEKPIDNARNIVVRDFLKKDYDYLLFIDSDNPPIRNPLDLVSLDKDIMVYPTAIWFGDPAKMSIGRPSIYWNCMKYVPEKDGWTEYHPQVGLQEIDAGGTGCMLIARRVLEKVKPPFIRAWDEDGVCVKGSDYLFCKRAKELGFSVWANFDYRCSHYKTIDNAALFKYLYIRDIVHAEQPNINTPEYWDTQWSERQERILPQYEMIAGMLNGHRVLDFGCGRGDLLSLLGPKAEGMDFSAKAVEICVGRGLKAKVGTEPDDRYDVIVSTEVLEHVDDDSALIEKFFQHADEIIYSVPNNCLPPGVEPEHRRVYTVERIREITPHLKNITEVGDYFLVHAKKESLNG